jgi:hypothetical protein
MKKVKMQKQRQQTQTQAQVRKAKFVLALALAIFLFCFAKAATQTQKIAQIKQDKMGFIYMRITDQGFENALKNALSKYESSSCATLCSGAEESEEGACGGYFTCIQEIPQEALRMLGDNYKKVILKFNNIMHIFGTLLEARQIGKIKLQTITFSQAGDVLEGALNYSGNIPFYIGDLLARDAASHLQDVVAYDFSIDLVKREIMARGGVGMKEKDVYSLFSGNGKIAISIDGASKTFSTVLGSFDVYAIPEATVKQKVAKQAVELKDAIKIFCGPSQYDAKLKQGLRGMLEWIEDLTKTSCIVESQDACVLPGPFKFATKNRAGILTFEDRLDVCSKVLIDGKGNRFRLAGKPEKDSAIIDINGYTYINPKSDFNFNAIALEGKEEIKQELNNAMAKSGKVSVCIPSSSLYGQACALQLLAISATPQTMEQVIANVKQNTKPISKTIGSTRYRVWEKSEGRIGIAVFETEGKKGKKITRTSFFSPQEKANTMVFYDLNSDGKPELTLFSDANKVKAVDEKILRGEKVESLKLSPDVAESMYDATLEVFTETPSMQNMQRFYGRYREERGFGRAREEEVVTKSE